MSSPIPYPSYLRIHIDKHHTQSTSNKQIMSSYESTSGAGASSSSGAYGTTSPVQEGAYSGISEGKYVGKVLDGPYTGSYGAPVVSTYTDYKDEAPQAGFATTTTQTPAYSEPKTTYEEPTVKSSQQYTAPPVAYEEPSIGQSGLDGTSVATGGNSGFGGNDSGEYKGALLQKDYDETKGGSRLGKEATPLAIGGAGASGLESEGRRGSTAIGGPESDRKLSMAQEASLTGEEPGYKMVTPHAAGKLHGQSAAEGPGMYGNATNPDTPLEYGTTAQAEEAVGHGKSGVIFCG